jgi:hypothetical protein
MMSGDDLEQFWMGEVGDDTHPTVEVQVKHKNASKEMETFL